MRLMWPFLWMLVLSFGSLSTLAKDRQARNLQLGVGSPWASYKVIIFQYLCIVGVRIVIDKFIILQATFNKVYNFLEDTTRYAIWLANVNAINAHNVAFSLGQTTYSMKQSPLTDRVTQNAIFCLSV